MINIFLVGLALTGSPTNLEMVETAAAEALQLVAEQLADQNIEVVYLNVLGEHAGGWLIEQIAGGVLGEAGIVVATTREDDLWTLNLRAMELGVTYSQTDRSWIFGGKEVPRQASCQIAATLIDPQGNVVLTAREGAVNGSRVSVGEIPLLESTTERWVNGTLSSQESGNVLEPLVVTGVVTALVYLFYSSRN